MFAGVKGPILLQCVQLSHLVQNQGFFGQLFGDFFGVLKGFQRLRMDNSKSTGDGTLLLELLNELIDGTSATARARLKSIFLIVSM